jgi:hypothetical protein
MGTKREIITGILLLFSLTFCQSQNVQYRGKLRPAVKAKLYSLYPNATGAEIDQSSIHDSIQIIRLNCNCKETSGMIVLVFDTNGNLLNKDIHFNSMKGLSAAIVNYIKTNTSPNEGFINNFYIKSINNKGEISYGIDMWESPGSWSRTDYRLKFKPTGELISKEVIPHSTL